MSRNPAIATLLEVEDEELRFDRLGDFVRRDAVVAHAVGQELVKSGQAKERVLGADVLGQVANVAPMAREQIAADLVAAFDPRDEGDVVASFATAMGHAADPRCKVVLVELAKHPDSRVRFAVAFALPNLGIDERTASTLRTLTVDPDPDVRDWATFALAESDLADEDTLRSLAARTDDAHDDTRAEAIYGLARRRDPRAAGLVKQEFTSPKVGALIFRARDELSVDVTESREAGPPSTDRTRD